MKLSSLNRSLETHQSWILFSITLLASLKCIVMFFMRGIFFLYGARVPDAQLYWTVGRAILNGFKPYIDIYENKPPGVFILSATSFYFFHDGTIGFVLDALILWILPALFAYFLYRSLRRTSAVHINFWLRFTLIFFSGCLLLLYGSNVAGPWQTEFYASFFAILYVFLLWERQQKWTVSDTIFACALMLLSMGFKEPFFLTFIGIALCMITDRRKFFYCFVLPITLTACFSVFLLYALGYGHGYFQVHLLAMLGHRVVQYSPILLRPFYLLKLLMNLWDFFPLFAIIPLLLFCSTVMIASRSNVRRIVRIALLCFSFFIAYMSVGIGGDFQVHHFAGMVPYYFALLIIVSTYLNLLSRSLLLVISMCTVLVALSFFFVPLSLSDQSYADQLRDIRLEDERAQTIAQSVDALLDACSIDRYFVIGEPRFFSWTRHTPLNFFLFSAVEHISRFGRVIAKRHFDAMGKAQIIFLPQSGYDFQPGNASEQAVSKVLASFLQTSFTTRLPDCALGHSVSQFMPIFRLNPGDTTPPVRL